MKYLDSLERGLNPSRVDSALDPAMQRNWIIITFVYVTWMRQCKLRFSLLYTERKPPSGTMQIDILRVIVSYSPFSILYFWQKQTWKWRSAKQRLLFLHTVSKGWKESARLMQSILCQSCISASHVITVRCLSKWLLELARIFFFK